MPGRRRRAARWLRSAYAGELTRLLADWAAQSDAHVVAVDPFPQEPLEALARERGELELIRRTSLEALPELTPTDAVIIDGDHNYYTVSEELRLMDEREGDLPLLMFHDVCWPHGRRDDYYDADQIPEDHRRPVAGEGMGILPGDPGVVADGLPYPRSTERGRSPQRRAHRGRGLRGRPRRPAPGGRAGVLRLRRGVAARRAVGGKVAPSSTPGTATPWWRDSKPTAQTSRPRPARQAALWRLVQRQSRQDAVLRRLLESSAFGLAERLSRLRARLGVARDASVVSKDEIRRALDAGD